MTRPAAGRWSAAGRVTPGATAESHIGKSVNPTRSKVKREPWFRPRRLRERLRVARPMLAGGLQEAAGNGPP
jgi:hypothetical protein